MAGRHCITAAAPAATPSATGGHAWHTCDEHGRTVLGKSDHGKGGCSCPPLLARSAVKSEAVERLHLCCSGADRAPLLAELAAQGLRVVTEAWEVGSATRRLVVERVVPVPTIEEE